MGVGVLAWVFRGRFTAVISVVVAYLVLASFPSTTIVSATQSPCIAKVTITIQIDLRVDLSQANPVNIDCTAPYMVHPTAGCVDWSSSFGRIYNAPTNDAACDAALAQSYEIFAPYAGNALALGSQGVTYPYTVYYGPFIAPFGQAEIQLSSGNTANLTFWWGDAGIKQLSVVPVNLDSTTLHCAYAYTCVSGSCLSDVQPDDRLCAAREIIHPTVACNTSWCGLGAVRCTSYCTDATATTCNAGLCTTQSECTANGFCLCPAPGTGVFGGAVQTAVSVNVIVILFIVAWVFFWILLMFQPVSSQAQTATV